MFPNLFKIDYFLQLIFLFTKKIGRIIFYRAMKKSIFKQFLLFSVFFLLFHQRVFTEEKAQIEKNTSFLSIHSHREMDLSNSTFIPFRYPLELNWIPSPESAQYGLDAERWILFPSTRYISLDILTPKIRLEEVSRISFKDGTTFRRDSSSGIPYLWQSNQSPMIGQTRDGMFVFLKRNVNLFLNMSMSLIGNSAGHAVLDHISASLGISYLVPSAYLYRKNLQANLHLNAQASEILPWEDKLKKTEPKNLRNYFISPGLTLGNRAVMLEGLIRMPIPANYQEMDALFQPEIQGRLGLKWILPEMMKP
jgi:hypothetical protein